MDFSRRDFVKLMGLGMGMMVVSACGGGGGGFLTSNSVGNTGSIPSNVEADLELIAMQDNIQILPGNKTSVFRYQAIPHQGNGILVQELSGSYLGPILRVRRGQRVRILFRNNLPSQPTIIHWHGLKVPERMDGHPRDAVQSGGGYYYDFQVINRAGTYWYHPHPDGLTGRQAYYGLAGLFILSDEEEDRAGLPAGEYDLPLVIQDRTFNSQNQLVYTQNMMDVVNGFLGNTVLVNGRPNALFNVKATAYRLRLLNGSNSRVYKIAWSDGAWLTVIATDGGLLERAVSRPYLTLGPGERVELWVDFSNKSEVRLVSLPFTDFNHGMMGGMMNGSGLPQGAYLEIAKFRVVEGGPSAPSLPSRLSTMERYDVKDASKQRSFQLVMQGMMTHTINGRTFRMEEVAEDEVVGLGSLEVWEFINMDTIPHSMHIHGVQFQVFERRVSSDFQSLYQEFKDGFVDEGWKDTVLVMPGETVRLLVRFELPGMYLYHCHNLEHEDAGMMRNYRVV